MEGETDKVWMAAEGIALVLRTRCTGCIFNKNEIMVVCKTPERIDIRRHSNLMYKENRLCLRSNPLLHILHIEIVSIRFHFCKHRLCTHVLDGIGCGDVAHRRADHLIIFSNASYDHAEMQRGCAV